MALSDDEGKTWRIKKLALATPNNAWTGVASPRGKAQQGFGTLGYCDATQSPDGIIHLMTSKGSPSMNFDMNETWILSADPGEAGPPANTSPHQTIVLLEKYPNGAPRITSHLLKAADGPVVLEGTEERTCENGVTQYKVSRQNGRKTGLENISARTADCSGRQTKARKRHGLDNLLAQRHEEIGIQLARRDGPGPCHDLDENGKGPLKHHLQRRPQLLPGVPNTGEE